MQLHHVAYVVNDIRAYASSLPGLVHEKTVFDPQQQAELALYRVGAGCRIELIAPQKSDAPTWSWRERMGEGLHHVCYNGVDREAIETVLRQYRLLKVLGPLHAVMFDSDVLFAVTRRRAIVEFLLDGR